MVDKNKICFIICVNNDFFYRECVKYIRWLELPEGMELEILEIRDAKSMASGYQRGMEQSNAKYKVYMHQDVFIINKYFIYDIVSIFKSQGKVIRIPVSHHHGDLAYLQTGGVKQQIGRAHV